MTDLSRRLETLLDVLRTRYDGIGHSSGRPYVYFVYPPEQERQVARLIHETFLPEAGLLFHHIDLLPLTISSLAGQEERRRALLEDPVKRDGARDSIMRLWALNLAREINKRLAAADTPGRPVVLLQGLAALHPLGHPTGLLEALAEQEPRDPTTGATVPIVAFIPGNPPTADQPLLPLPGAGGAAARLLPRRGTLMLIRETFATRIQDRIEPVVKVSERQPAVVLKELANLVVTPQWEKYLHRILDAYTDAAEREDESGIGIWISGFFGSGKSLLMKTLGALLEGGDLQGQSVHTTFLERLPASSAERADLTRFLKICERKVTTTAVGGNLHALQAASSDPLALIVFKLFAQRQGYTHNWPLAWAVEHPIAARNMTGDFRQQASDRCGVPWDEVANDPEFYSEQLYQAAAAVLPDHFSGIAAVDRAVSNAVQSGITPASLIERLRRWCEVRDAAGRRHKLLLQLDELGQWIASGNANERTMQVQALAETAATAGAGRIWVAVTAHGDVQALQQNVDQSQYAKINQRFALRCPLSNDDISRVVEERLLRKT